MNEIKCNKVDKKKLILRTIFDFIVIFILLYLITFVEYIINDFSKSFSYIFNEKRILFFVMLTISLALSIVLSFIDIGSRCIAIKYDDEKLIFIKNNKEDNMRLSSNLFVRSEAKENCIIFSFRQDKRAVNAYLNKTDGIVLIDHIRSKGIVINNQTSKKILPKSKALKQFHNDMQNLESETTDNTDELITKSGVSENIENKEKD